MACNKWREDQERRVLPSGSRNSQGPRHQPSNICRTPCKALFNSEGHKRCPRLELRQTCITHTIIRTQNVNIHATRTSRMTLNEAYMDNLEEKKIIMTFLEEPSLRRSRGGQTTGRWTDNPGCQFHLALRPGRLARCQHFLVHFAVLSSLSQHRALNYSVLTLVLLVTVCLLVDLLSHCAPPYMSVAYIVSISLIKSSHCPHVQHSCNTVN